MSRQKCMSCIFQNAAIQKLKTSHISDFVIKEIKGRIMISNKQNVENEAFKVGFALLKIKLIEKFKLKIELTETKI